MVKSAGEYFNFSDKCTRFLRPYHISFRNKKSTFLPLGLFSAKCMHPGPCTTHMLDICLYISYRCFPTQYYITSDINSRILYLLYIYDNNIYNLGYSASRRIKEFNKLYLVHQVQQIRIQVILCPQLYKPIFLRVTAILQIVQA